MVNNNTRLKQLEKRMETLPEITVEPQKMALIASRKQILIKNLQIEEPKKTKK